MFVVPGMAGFAAFPERHIKITLNQLLARRLVIDRQDLPDGGNGT
jgi:hypothetical protein